MDRIAIFGLGKMGLPLACAFAEKDFQVTGIDVNAEWVAKINAKHDVLPQEPGVHAILAATLGRKFTATTDSDVSGQDVIIILVPTLIHATENGVEADLGAALQVATTIGRTLNKGSLVITECTMPPGATEKIGAAIEKVSGLKAGHDFGLSHCPERTSSGVALRDIRGQYPKVVGADDEPTRQKVSRLYEKINSKGVIAMPSIRMAECVKVFEGIYRDVNIGLSNELAKYCRTISVDAIEVFEAANTQPYCHLHMPSCGVGGHCIPYYPYFVMTSKTPIISAARQTNDSMPQFTVDLLAPKAGATVGLLGLTYRGGVKEFHKSPALDILRILAEKKVHVVAHDPLCTDSEIRAIGAEPLADYALDGLIVASNHPEYRVLDWPRIIAQMHVKTVVDGCRALDPQAIRNAGGKYVGVGRA